MSDYTPETAQIRDAVSQYGAPTFTVAEFDRWLAEVERAAAEKAFTEAASVAGSLHAYRGSVEQWSGREIASELHRRAEACRREGKE